MNIQSTDGHTALIWGKLFSLINNLIFLNYILASIWNYEAIVKLLLDKGADTNPRDKHELTAFGNGNLS